MRAETSSLRSGWRRPWKRSWSSFLSSRRRTFFLIKIMFIIKEVFIVTLFNYCTDFVCCSCTDVKSRVERNEDVEANPRKKDIVNDCSLFQIYHCFTYIQCSIHYVYLLIILKFTYSTSWLTGFITLLTVATFPIWGPNV